MQVTGIGHNLTHRHIRMAPPNLTTGWHIIICWPRFWRGGGSVGLVENDQSRAVHIPIANATPDRITNLLEELMQTPDYLDAVTAVRTWAAA